MSRPLLTALLAACALACAPAVAGAATGPALSVDVTAGTHAISPLIYGMNFADAATATALRLPVDRWGGNTTDTYNWQAGSANTGNDWFFENIPDCWNGAAGWCHGGAGPNRPGYLDFVDKDRAAGAATLLTVPLMGYVAKDAKLGHPFTCGFPASVFATQNAFDPYDAGCGNGMNGNAKLKASPTRDGVKINTAKNARLWVRDLVGRYGRASAGGVGFYELGNEPALWDSTHRDMHPAPETASELVSRSLAAADAIKKTDPTAAVVGFSDWGWPAYFCSGADTPGNGCSDQGCTTSPDCANHGHAGMAAWFLRQFRLHDQAVGHRRLDYLDVHYYAQGGSTTDVTRSLWDPTYTDPSWIGTQIRLLPRMREWIAAEYPGTKTALTEYNLSVGDARTNALIQADTLGILAREDVGLATRWAMGNDGDQIAHAFALYRNYDGAGGRFGDTYEQSVSADQAKVAVYAARRAADGAQTVVVINKTAGALTSTLTFAHLSGAAAAAHRWEWAGAAISAKADVPVSAGALTATFPARSATVLVLPAV